MLSLSSAPVRPSIVMPSLAAVVAVAIFVVDTVTPLDIAVAVLYVAVVLLAMDFAGREFKSRYKILIAPLIMDLDNRLNVNTSGNIMGMSGPNNYTYAHNSNQGWGPWEVNPYKLTTSYTTEMANLFLGSPAPAAPYAPVPPSWTRDGIDPAAPPATSLGVHVLRQVVAGTPLAEKNWPPNHNALDPPCSSSKASMYWSQSFRSLIESRRAASRDLTNRGADPKFRGARERVPALSAGGTFVTALACSSIRPTA